MNYTKTIENARVEAAPRFRIRQLPKIMDLTVLWLNPDVHAYVANDESRWSNEAAMAHRNEEIRKLGLVVIAERWVVGR